MRDLKRVNSQGVGKSLGFGFINFKEHKHALSALRTTNNNPELFGEKKVKVQLNFICTLVISFLNNILMTLKSSLATLSLNSTFFCLAFDSGIFSGEQVSTYGTREKTGEK